MKKNIITTIVVLVAFVGGWYIAAQPHTTPANKTQLNTVTFLCEGGKAIDAVFYERKVAATPKEGEPLIPSGSVALTFTGGHSAMTLNQTLSADGARYANADESFVFWNKGNGVMVLENDKEQNYKGCIVVVPKPVGSDLSQIYTSTRDGFSLRIAPGYTSDDSYYYSLNAPDLVIGGVKFTIPPAFADGTNLAHDTYISIESLPDIKDCTATPFLLYTGVSPKNVTENGVTYSYAATVGAGAGNRYEETIYALPGSNPCRAIRYFVHYGVIENYPTGAVREFDKKALLEQFDIIRSTLVTR